MAAGPGADRRLSARHVGLALLIAGGLLCAWLMFLFVPWQPVPGGMPEAVPADRIFTAEEIERGEAYAGLARIIGWSSLAITLAVAAWLGFTRRGAHLLDWLRAPWPVMVVLMSFTVLAISTLATLPVVILGWDRRKHVGLTEQSLLGLLRDQGVALAIEVVFTSVAMLVLIGVARALPRWWPAVAGLLGGGLVIASTYLYPVVVEPAFNSFTPLPAGQLHQRIDSLAVVEGVPLDEVLVADASRRTTALNAYVSGFGDSRRVVIYDTLLEQLPEDEVVTVVAHELAHARNADVEIGTALGVAGTLAGIGLLALLLHAPAVRRRADVTGAGDPRVVALVLALSAFGSLGGAPLENAISRQFEARADVDALKATGDPVAFVELQRHLALAAVSDPTPPAWSQWWFGSHPTVLQRIAVAEALSTRTG